MIPTNEESFLVYVVNLANPTANRLVYTCSPEDAVIAAYAQARKDWSTWQYRERYGHLLERGRWTVLCGDFSAFYRCPTCGNEMRTAHLLNNRIGCYECICKARAKLEKAKVKTI